MKKEVKFSLCTLGSGIGLAVLGWGLVCILQHYGLMFRAWVGITFFAVMVLLGFALLGGIIYTLAKINSRPEEGITRKIASAIGIIAVLLGTGVFGIFVLFGSVFAYQPEHVVEKYGQKMVAYVNSFLDVNVSYHEYRNFLVCGYPELGWEWYGDGGYDPFEYDSTPEPKTYKFFDVEGNLITQSEEKQNITQGESGKEPEVSVFPPEKMQCRFSNSDARTSSEMSYSTDGENWKEINTDYHYQFFFENIGYLIFSYEWAMQHEAAAICKSIDGGKNWFFVSVTPLEQLLQNTVFFDENTGIFEYGSAGADSYVLYVTTDGASTFNKVELPAEIQGQAKRIKEYIKNHELSN